MTKDDIEVLADHLDEVLDYGLEIDVLEWLARNRRAESAAGHGDTHRIDEAVAQILEEAAQKSNDLRSELASEMPVAEVADVTELTEEEAATILNRQVPAMLDDGFEEPEIVKAMALWRLAAINDEERLEEKKIFDRKAHEIWSAAAGRLEALLEEAADDLDFGDLEEKDERNEDHPVKIVAMPALLILGKKPDLFHEGVDFAQLTKRLNQTGRNEPCPCESGKKFKKCCGSSV